MMYDRICDECFKPQNGLRPRQYVIQKVETRIGLTVMLPTQFDLQPSQRKLEKWIETNNYIFVKRIQDFFSYNWLEVFEILGIKYHLVNETSQYHYFQRYIIYKNNKLQMHYRTWTYRHFFLVYIKQANNIGHYLLHTLYSLRK